jgi:hypothetical protein
VGGGSKECEPSEKYDGRTCHWRHYDVPRCDCQGLPE